MSIRDSEMMALSGPLQRPDSRPTLRNTEDAGDFMERSLRLRTAHTALLLAGRASPTPPRLGSEAGRVLWVSLDVPRPEVETRLNADTLMASVTNLPFRKDGVDAVAEFQRSLALAAESDSEAIHALSELSRVLAPGGRYLCGGGLRLPVNGVTAGADKRRIDEWRPEGGGVWHHIARVARSDGSWRRLHERLRVRRFDEVDYLLSRTGFAVLNAFTGYSQQFQTSDPAGDAILLCERI